MDPCILKNAQTRHQVEVQDHRLVCNHPCIACQQFIWLYFGGQEYSISYPRLCPKLEYASSVWNPYTQCNVEKIEMVQCLVARSVYQDHSQFSHFSLVIKELGWDSLQHHRLVNQVGMFYRIYKGHVGVSLPAETSRNKNTETSNKLATFILALDSITFHIYSEKPF